MQAQDLETDNINLQAKASWWGRGLIVAAAVLWSTSGFFAKAPIFDAWSAELRPTALTFWRAAFASIVLLCFVREVKWSWRLIPLILIFAAMSWTYLSALVYTEATLAIWLQYSAPAWVLIVGFLLFREKPRSVDVIFLVLAITGVTIIIAGQLAGSLDQGVVFGLLSGLCFAFVILLLRNLRDFDAAWLIFLNHAAIVVLLLPLVLGHGRAIMPSGNQWIYLAAFGGIQMGIPYYLFARGLKAVISHEASGLLLLEPVLVPVWVYVAWHSSSGYAPPSVTTVIGAFVILLSLGMRYGHEIARYRSRARKSPAHPTDQAD